MKWKWGEGSQMSVEIVSNIHSVKPGKQTLNKSHCHLQQMVVKGTAFSTVLRILESV